MDFTEQDIATMRKQGDLVGFIGLVSGFAVSTPPEDLKKSCSHCGASAGEKCTTPRGKRIESGVHASRKEGGQPAAEKRKPGQWPSPPGSDAGAKVESWHTDRHQTLSPRVYRRYNVTPSTPELSCAGCGKKPEELSEYRVPAKEEGVTPAQYAWHEEGTLNRETGQFLCTICYVAKGAPATPRGWNVP